MSSKTPRPQQQQVALARKAAALKAAAKAKAPPQTRQGVRERNVRARIAADAYVAEQEQRQEEPRARLLSKRQVLDRVCVTFPTLWKWMRAGTFPRARVIGGKSVWLEHEVNAWIAGLPVRRLKGDASEIEVA